MRGGVPRSGLQHVERGLPRFYQVIHILSKNRMVFQNGLESIREMMFSVTEFHSLNKLRNIRTYDIYLWRDDAVCTTWTAWHLKQSHTHRGKEWQFDRDAVCVIGVVEGSAYRHAVVRYFEAVRGQSINMKVPPRRGYKVSNAGLNVEYLFNLIIRLYIYKTV